MHPNTTPNTIPNPRDSSSKTHIGRIAITPGQTDKLIRLSTVIELTGLKKSSIYSIPDFPKRVVLSRRAVGWRLSEIHVWIESRSAVGA